MKNSIAPKLGTAHAEVHAVLHTESPVGLILCADSSREQVELLQLHKDGITVAEYWTEQPPKADLVQKLHAALLEARERLARRGVLLGDLDDGR
jgi:hypothetical protein